MHDQPMLSADERGRYARHLILPEVGLPVSSG
jgi:adenylyltransferase/sulfurtransferase